MCQFQVNCGSLRAYTAATGGGVKKGCGGGGVALMLSYQDHHTYTAHGKVVLKKAFKFHQERVCSEIGVVTCIGTLHSLLIAPGAVIKLLLLPIAQHTAPR